MPGETSNNQSNFNRQKVSLYAYLYEKHVEIRNVDGTVEITPDKYSWDNGGVVLEYVDCRQQPTCTGKRIFLRQNTASLWDDVLRMNQDAGGTWTQEIASQAESQLLLRMHPTIDLNPSSTLQGMKKYDPADGPVVPVHRELKTRKRKLNSYELEQEVAKKAKKEQMMFMMDERHGKEFKPTFKLLPYFKSNRNKVGKGKQRTDTETAEQSRGAKKLGRRFVRQLRFERSFTEEIDKVYKLFTLLNIYQEANGKHEAIFHSLNEKDLRAEGKYISFMQTIADNKDYKLDDSRATFRNELVDAEAYKAFIKSFVVLYSIDNNLKYDSERIDKVPVEMLTEVTTELTSPQTEMKFDNMQPYKIIELLAQQSDTEKPTSSNEGLSVADFYNAAAKKAMQAKPSASVPVNQGPSLMPPPQRPPTRRNSNRSKIATTQAQVTTPVQSQNNVALMQHRVANQPPAQQPIPPTLIQQPQVMAASQSPSQRPIMQSPVLIQQSPVQVPVSQLSTDRARPIQQIPIPTNPRQVPIQIPPQQIQLMQRTMPNNVQAIHSMAYPNGRQIPVRMISQHANQINARSAASQSVAQGTTIQGTIASPSMLNSRQKPIPVRITQGQLQQMNVSAQQTSQINIPTQTNSSQINQVQMNQINIPTQPTDPTRVTPQLNVQNQIDQPTQINIPSDQVNIQQTPRINSGRNPRMIAQTSMNQARPTLQINIPSDQTPRNNPAQVPQVNATDQMNAQILQRINPRMNIQNIQLQPNEQNVPGVQRINQGRPQLSIQQFAAIQHQQNRLMVTNNNGQIFAARHPARMMNVQQPFMQLGGQSLMVNQMQNQLLSGQPNVIRTQGPQVRQILRQQPMYIRQQMIPQQMAVNQPQLGIQMNGNPLIFQNQPSQQPQHPQNPWNGNGNNKQ